MCVCVFLQKHHFVGRYLSIFVCKCLSMYLPTIRYCVLHGRCIEELQKTLAEIDRAMLRDRYPELPNGHSDADDSLDAETFRIDEEIKAMKCAIGTSRGSSSTASLDYGKMDLESSSSHKSPMRTLRSWTSKSKLVTPNEEPKPDLWEFKRGGRGGGIHWGGDKTNIRQSPTY